MRWITDHVEGAVESPALLLRGIEKAWSGRPILTGLNALLEPGTSISISGANGAGKTTLLRIAAGLISPEEGEISAFGLEPERDRAAYQSRVGFLSAGNTGLYARLKAENHLELAARLALMPRREQPEAIARVIERFGLTELRGRRVDRLSMGQRQRLRLALTFLHGPSLVLLDEPATSLDEEGIGQIGTALEELKVDGGAAIVALPSGWDDVLAVDAHFSLTDGRLAPA